MHADHAQAELAVALLPRERVRQRPNGVDAREVEELHEDRPADLLRHAQERDVDPLEIRRELRRVRLVVGREPQRIASSSLGETHSSTAHDASSIGTAIATVTNVAAIRW